MCIVVVLNIERLRTGMYEVEIKGRAKEDTLERLKKLAKETGHIVHEDIYLNHPNRDFAVTDEALRIRRADDKLVLSYKGAKIDGETKTRLELESNIGEEMLEILMCLGFKKIYTVEKQRTFYEYDGAKITYDIVDGLGEYIELEKKVETLAEVEDTKEELFEVFKKLGFEREESERKSYLELLLEKKN